MKSKGHDGGLYRAAQLLVQALLSGATSPLEKIRLSQSLQTLREAEIESLETLYQLEGPQDVEVVSDRNPIH
jgi:hypothetical protein